MVHVSTTRHFSPTLCINAMVCVIPNLDSNDEILLRSDNGSFQLTISLQHMVFHMHSFTRPGGEVFQLLCWLDLECLHLTSVTNVSLETFRLIVRHRPRLFCFLTHYSLGDAMADSSSPTATLAGLTVSSEGQCLSMEGGRFECECGVPRGRERMNG